MTVVVTGASGHVGANLVRALLQQGHRVRVVVHNHSRSLDGLDVERVHGDVRDHQAMVQAFKHADVVYHLAALISIMGGQKGLVHSINVDGARTVAQAALAAGVRRMVHVSSVHAFDLRNCTRPINETDPKAIYDGALAYDRSKAMGEQAVRSVIAQGLDCVIVNPAGVIGPDDHEPSRMGSFLLKLFRGEMLGLVDGAFSWVDVRDVVHGIMAAAERGTTGENYILAGATHSIEHLGQLAEAVSSVPKPRIVSPIWLAYMAAPFNEMVAAVRGVEPKFSRESLRTIKTKPHFDYSKAERELGFRSRPLDESIRDLHAWYCEQQRVAPPKAGSPNKASSVAA